MTDYPVNMDIKPEVEAFFDEPTNTISYIVKDPSSDACAIIDSVMDIDYAAGRITYEAADKLIAEIEDRGLTVDWIIETHVHADHLSAAPYLQDKLGGQIGVGVDENGKRIRKTIFADTRAGVAKELAEMHASVCAHRLMPSNDIRLGHFINKWLRDFKRPEVSLGTYEWYINISKMVSKDIKDTYLNKVNTYQIQNMLNTLKNRGASVRTIKAVYIDR